MKETFLSRFTPSMMAPEALEALFVQREELAERIVDLVRDSALTSSKHHTLLIGPRGIGKTHLIALIYHRLQAMEDLRDHLLVAWLREEEWGVTSFMDLLLRIFRALLAEYNDPGLAKRVEALYELPLKLGEPTGGALLKEFVNNRTLLVLVENLDDLFGGLGDEGQKRLRAYLQENPFFTFLATAQTLFNGIALQTSPFYGFFRIHHLEELGFDGAARLLANIATYVSNNELASFIQTPTGRARIRAVHHLAGGNHRVYVIFSEFLTRESLNDLVEPFIRTLDNLTPYYQARMNWLSAQQRKIMEFLCDRRGAVPVKEIAQRCFMTHQTASSQLKDLREKGYVRSESVGRESYYELREPLMRLCIEVKKNRGEPIRLLVDFLRLWHSRTELQQRLALLQSDAALEREYLLHALRLTEEEKEDPRVISCLKDCKAYVKKGDYIGALQTAEELVAIRGDVEDWVNQGHYLVHLKRAQEALASCNRAIELAPENARAWFYRGFALDDLGRHEEALASFDKAIELEPNKEEAWGNRGITLRRLGRHEEALASFDKAIELEPNEEEAWGNRGITLRRLGHHEEALASFDKAIELKPDDSPAWLYRGLTLENLQRSKDALDSYSKAIELNSTSAHAWYHRGVTLGDLGRHEEALACLDKAIELDPDNAPAWVNRGAALLSLGRHNEALDSYDKAITLRPNESRMWFHRGSALSKLARHDEALAAYDKAIAMDSSDAHAWFHRGVELGNQGHFQEALVSFDRAMELGEKSSNLFFFRAEALLALNRWGDGSAALDDALRRFAHSDKPNTGDTDAIFRNLLTSARDMATLQMRIKTLIDLYARHQALPALGQGLVQSISALTSVMVSGAAARMWLESWRELVGDRKELELPLRLLDATIRYRETHDPRILLELPVEERTLLEPLLGMKEPPAHEPVDSSTVSKQRQRIRSRGRRKPKT